MKRRKFLALTAALVLAATTGLASCGNNSGSKGDTKELNMILYPDYVPQSVIDIYQLSLWWVKYRAQPEAITP